MADLQELILRARFIFLGAVKRFELFKLITGRNSTKDISKKTGRRLSSVLHDIEKLRDLELIRERKDTKGVIKKDGATVFEKSPLIKHVSDSYLKDVADTSKIVKKKIKEKGRVGKLPSINIPTINDILDISKEGENQLYEFKAPGIEMDKLSKEIAAFLHTKHGGIIFYGIEDDGTIISSDLKRQDFDQRIQNSVRNNINPAPHIEIKERDVLGSKIILVIIPPWDKINLYHYKNKYYYIRKGTNIFQLQPHEIKKLSNGNYVV